MDIKVKLKNYIFWLLSRKDYTEKEMRNKIKLRGYKDPDWLNIDIAVIDQVLEEIKALNYINDDKYLDRYIRLKHEYLYGESKIRFDLKSKGFKENEINNLLMNYDFFETAKLYQEKIFDIRKEDDIKYMKKIKDKMLRRGFSYEQINESLKKIN